MNRSEWIKNAAVALLVLLSLVCFWTVCGCHLHLHIGEKAYYGEPPNETVIELGPTETKT